jgi:hypothetical protein
MSVVTYNKEEAEPTIVQLIDNHNGSVTVVAVDKTGEIIRHSKIITISDNGVYRHYECNPLVKIGRVYGAGERIYDLENREDLFI